MKTQIDIEKIIKEGKIDNELDFERALIAERRLRVISKDNPSVKKMRHKLRDIISEYENRKWSDISTIDHDRIKESDDAEYIAQREMKFIDRRKRMIKEKLKELNISQQELGIILGHRSKTHMSELMNGICPFPLKDLIIINRLMKIEMKYLIPKFLSISEQDRIKAALRVLNKPQIKLTRTDFVRV